MNKNMKNKFYVGQTVSIKKVVRGEDVEKFAELSGDFNCLHLDKEIASKSLFGDRVCHGMLIGSYISAVLGTHLPGKGTIYLGQELKFLKPVYFDEELEISVEIEEIIQEKDIIILKTVVTKEDNILVIVGKAKVMYKEIR